MEGSVKSTSILDFKPGGKKPVFAFVALYSFESFAIRSIATTLRRAGHDVLEVYYDDFKSNQFKYPGPDDLTPFLNLLREKRVDIVGLSLRSSYRKIAGILTEAIHRDLGLPVIWGSTHPTIMPEDSISVADVVCRGEGETPMLELASRLSQGIDISGIHNLWLKKGDGTVIRNELGPYAPLDSLPDPEYGAPGKYFLKDGVMREGDPLGDESTYAIMASRGCPHYCTFCTNAFYLNANPKYLRFRSVDRVIGEVKRARELMPGIKRVKFYDDQFATNKKWIDEFVEKWRHEVGLPFDAYLNPQNVTRTLVGKLKLAGVTVIEMGIQSGSERVANEVFDRRITREKLLRAANIMHESGVRVNYGVITDNPLETSQDKRDALDFLLQIPRPYILFLMSLTYFPGTPLTERLLKEGHITENDVEGKNDKSLYHWEASFSYKRKPEDRFWLALMSLLPKDFIPKGFIRFLSNREFLMRHPAPLVAFAWFANIFKLVWLAARKYREGSLTPQVLRRHVNLRHLAVK
jgi:radical SAM superfamily enzyme YgiQ (UPF0313 family)